MGAGNIFGGAKVFARISPNSPANFCAAKLPLKFFSHELSQKNM